MGGGEPLPLGVYSFGRTRAEVIAARANEVARELLQAASVGDVRDLLQAGAGFYVLEWCDGAGEGYSLDSVPALELFMASPKQTLPWLLDRRTLVDHPLRLVLQQAQTGSIDLFYWEQNGFAEIYLLDENNWLLRQRVPFAGESSLLLPWQRFFDALQQRQNRWLPEENSLRPGLHVRYHRLLPAGGLRARSFETCQLPARATGHFYMVQAIVSSGGDRKSTRLNSSHVRISYAVFCLKKKKKNS